MFIGPRWLQLLVLLLLFLGTLAASPKLIVWEGNPLARGSGAPIDSSPLGQTGLVDYLKSMGYNVSLSLSEAASRLRSGYNLALFIGAPSLCSKRQLSLYRGLVELAAAKSSRILIVVADENACYEDLAYEAGIGLVPEEQALLVTRDGLKAIPVMYGEGRVLVTYTARSLSSLPVAWQPEAVSIDPPGGIVAASATLSIKRGTSRSQLVFYLIADSDIFRNVVFNYNETGVKQLVSYLLGRYSLRPGDTLVVVPVDFTIGSSPVDLATHNPVALFHPGILSLVLAQLYLSGEKSFISFLYTQPLLLLAIFLALSLLAYTLIARQVEEKLVTFTPPQQPRVVRIYGASPLLEALLSRKIGRRDAKLALLNLYSLLDSTLRHKYGKGVVELMADKKLLAILARDVGIDPEELEKRLASLHKNYLLASGKKKLPPPQLLPWKRILDKELGEIEPVLQATGTELREMRGLEIDLIR